jgi:hypothetical protein
MSSLSKKARFFGENILKIMTSVVGRIPAQSGHVHERREAASGIRDGSGFFHGRMLSHFPSSAERISGPCALAKFGLPSGFQFRFKCSKSRPG